jgi:hypothetical protein
MQPNPTNDRLSFILKQYGKKRPDIVLYMVSIIAHTVGVDDWILQVRRSLPASMLDVFEGWLANSRTDEGGELENLAGTIVEIVNRLPEFRTRHRADPLFPWIANQLAKLQQVWRPGGDPSVREWVSKLRRGGTMLAQWFEATRPNLGEFDLDSAWDEAEVWSEENEGSSSVSQGEVVADLSDGWTAQKLTTEDQLDDEGEEMQHCVGSYAYEVSRGRTTIYSLRDANGRPHVTIEVSNNKIEQIRGKQNEEPAEKYKKYVEEFKGWLAETGVKTEKYPAYLREIAELLEQRSDTDEESIEYMAEKWHDVVGRDVDLMRAWGEVVGYGEPSFVGVLTDSSVIPEELKDWPFSILYKLEAEPEHSKADDMIKLARLAVELSRLDGLRDAPETTLQTEMFGTSSPMNKQLRVPGRPDLGIEGYDPLVYTTTHVNYTPSILLSGQRDVLTLVNGTQGKGSAQGKGRVQLLNLDSPAHVTHPPGWAVERHNRSEIERWVFPAEEWLAAGFEASSNDDDNDVYPWFVHRFTPSEAAEWKHLDVDGYLAYQLRRHRVTYRMAEEVDDVIEAHVRDYVRRWTKVWTKMTDKDAAMAERRRLALATALDIAHEIDSRGIRRNSRRKRTSRR